MVVGEAVPGDASKPDDRRAGSRELSTLWRGIEVLQVLQQWTWKGEGWGNNRIAEYLDADKSQVSRTLRVLTEAGLVVRDEVTRSYRLGPRMYSLGMRAADQQLMRAAAAVILRAAEAVDARAFLVVRIGTEVCTIWSEQPETMRPFVDSIGMVYPVIATDTGRALMYNTPDAEIRKLLQGGVHTSAQLEQFISRVHEDRGRGFSSGLVQDGSSAVLALPVWGAGRSIVATLGAEGPALLDQANIIPAVRVLSQTAAAITRRYTAVMDAHNGTASVPYQGWPDPPKFTRH